MRRSPGSWGLEGADVLGFIGSFYDYEGLDDLIAAMPPLVAARPNARLLMVGGGPMAEALRAQAATSPAAPHIHFVGRVPHTEGRAILWPDGRDVCTRAKPCG